MPMNKPHEYNLLSPPERRLALTTAVTEHLDALDEWEEIGTTDLMRALLGAEGLASRKLANQCARDLTTLAKGALADYHYRQTERKADRGPLKGKMVRPYAWHKRRDGVKCPHCGHIIPKPKE